MKRIESRSNPGWRELIALAGSARERRRQGRTVLEGIHLVDAWLRQGRSPDVLVVGDSAFANPEVQALLARLARLPDAHAPWQVADKLFAELSQVEHGIPLAAVIAVPAPASAPRFDADAVYLDRLQDPGNLGTILRTCAAVGVTQVWTAPGTTACWSPKVLRAAMGAHFALSLHEQLPWTKVAEGLAMPAMLTTADGQTTLFAADLRAPRVWILGNEGAGVDPVILAMPSGMAALQTIAIPQASAVESLNVAAAAAVCLYEQWRQRQTVGERPV